MTFLRIYFTIVGIFCGIGLIGCIVANLFPHGTVDNFEHPKTD